MQFIKLKVKYTVILALLPIVTLAETIEQINHIAISGNIDKALSLTKASLKNDSNNGNLHILYAKLLFWNHDATQALQEIKGYQKLAPKLYKQIYVAWANKKLKQIKHPDSALEFISTLPTYAKYSYDICWISIDSNIKLKRLRQALYLSKKLAEKYPKSQEAQERLATLLFWNHKYGQSLSLYKKLYKQYKDSNYKQQIIKLSKAIKDTKKIQINKIAKKRIKDKRVLSDKKDKRMIGIGIERSYYSDKRYKDITKYIEFTTQIKTWNVYIKANKTSRYGLNDFKIYSEIYPKLPLRNSWGYLSLSYAPNAKFFSTYSIGWHQYYDISKLELGAGVQYSHYQNKNITLFSYQLSYYFNQNLTAEESIYRSLPNKSYAFVTKIDYKFSEHSKVNAEFSFGNSFEKNKTLVSIKEHKLQIGGEFGVGNGYTLGGSVGKKWLKINSIRTSSAVGKIFIRKYW